MDENPNQRHPDDEPLSEVPPAPVVQNSSSEAGMTFGEFVVLVGGGIAASFLFAATMLPCVGATRSAKLKWAERNDQIEQAERDARIAEERNL